MLVDDEADPPGVRVGREGRTGRNDHDVVAPGDVALGDHALLRFRRLEPDQERNRESTGGDATQHPEFALARWAAIDLTSDERDAATVYTSGEHCPMCAAAQAWVGLGRLVYASSTEQLVQWRAEFGLPAGPVRPLPVQEVAPGVVVEGPSVELAPLVHDLLRRRVQG